MRNISLLILIISISYIMYGCRPTAPAITDEATYKEAFEEWQHQRLERLKGEKGWLNLAGLFWLSEGDNSFGSDGTNDIIFPEKADPFCGTLQLNKGEVKLIVSVGVEISVKDSLVSEIKMADDHTKNTTHLRQGDLSWYIIKRGERYGIRLRDLKHPRLEELDHIPSYPVNTNYVVEAVLEAFDAPKTMTVATPVEGYTESYQCPGILNFSIQGEDLKLHPFTSGKGYFLVIADETTGLDTYGAGRFMYTEPDSTGRIILDFNRATNPPCAFSPFATCPMPPRENFLPVTIEAGEKSVHLQ